MSEPKPARHCLACGDERLARGSFVVLRGITAWNIDRATDLPNHVCAAWVCLSCGYVAWYVRNPEELFAPTVPVVARDPEPFLEPIVKHDEPYRGAVATNDDARTVLIHDPGLQPIAVLEVLTIEAKLDVSRARDALRAMPCSVPCGSTREAIALVEALAAAGAHAERIR